MSSKDWQDKLPTIVGAILGTIFVLFLLLPLLGLIWRAIQLGSGAQLADLSIISAVSLSLGTTAVTTFLLAAALPASLRLMAAIAVGITVGALVEREP